VIDLLAIAEAGAEPPPPVVAVDAGGVSVLCTASAGEAPDAEALWRHEKLLEELMERRPILPVRYGTRVADEAGAAAAVAGRGAELAARLDRVRGAVELAVRALSTEEEAPLPEPASGTEYLRVRTARSHVADGVHEALSSLARESRTRPSADALRAAYLVDRDAVEGFVARVRELQREHPELAILCTGPWPPYSFAEPGP
jgi:Gas vesicle synthesis protein GvpL/GvpF